jgi:UDP-glucose 4-epimerase
MNILVTGGAGFIGSHVVDRLLFDGHRVSVLDDLSSGRPENVDARATLCVCDIRSPELPGLVAAQQPDAIVHLAAQASVVRSVADPAFDASVNIVGTLGLLEAARYHGIRRVVYVSTGGAAYGDTDVLPTPEDHPIRPTSPYGISKTTAERYLECWAELTGGHACVLRLANVYGPRQQPHGEAGVVAIFVHRLLTDQPCIIHGDGEQTRDYVYVEDVADSVGRALVTSAPWMVANIGTGCETSVNVLYQMLCHLLGEPRRADHGPARPAEQRRSALDASRARQILGWVPATPLETGLRRTLAASQGPDSHS